MGSSVWITPHPPFGHLLPQGEKAIELRVFSQDLLLPLGEGGAQRRMRGGAKGPGGELEQ